MKINPSQMETNARVLDPPEISYGKGGSAKPMFSGRWDLRGKIFSAPNPAALNAWGVLVLAGTEGGSPRAVPSQDVVKAFIQNFVKIYKGHGGVVANSQPAMIGGIPEYAMPLSTM